MATGETPLGQFEATVIAAPAGFLEIAAKTE
jgi:hypothetical protein